MRIISDILRWIVDQSRQSRKEARLQIETNEKLVAWVFKVEKRLADLEAKRGDA